MNLVDYLVMTVQQVRITMSCHEGRIIPLSPLYLLVPTRTRNKRGRLKFVCLNVFSENIFKNIVLKWGAVGEGFGTV